MDSEKQGLCSPGPPAPVPSTAGCANRPSRQATGILVGLSSLAMTTGCWVLPIQVGWDPSLIFHFNKLVRIYFLSMFCFNLCRLL